MKSGMAYSIIVFYGLLSVIAASIGHYFDKKNGFSNGYVAGVCISLILWFTYGKKMANA